MRSQRYVFLALFALCAVAAAVPLACGGGTTDGPPPPMCGNGTVESGEECDLGANNGNPDFPCSKQCKRVIIAYSKLNVNWTILKDIPIEGFTGTNCAGVGAEEAQIILVGPDGLHFEDTVECTQYSKMYSSICVQPDGGPKDCSQRLPLGNYQATITLRRADHTAISQAISSARGTLFKHGDSVSLHADVGYDDLLNKGTLKGSLRLDLSWGEFKKNCDTATPPVEKESLKLTVGSSGKVVTSATLPGTPLDGTASKCYVPGGNRTEEEAQNLSIGSYILLIRGYTAGSNVPLYCKRQEVFVGPGTQTDVYHIIVPAVVSPDAGMCD